MAVVVRELVEGLLGVLAVPERTADALVRPVVPLQVPDVPLVVDSVKSREVLSFADFQTLAQL